MNLSNTVPSEFVPIVITSANSLQSTIEEQNSGRRSTVWDTDLPAILGEANMRDYYGRSQERHFVADAKIIFNASI